MMLPTVIRGFSEEYGSWKTIWTCRRYARSCSKESPPIDAPSKRMSPEVGVMSFMIIRPVVVLPQPDSPTRPTVSPPAMSKLIPSTARTARAGPRSKSPRRTGKCFTRFLTSMSGGCAGIPSPPETGSAPPGRRRVSTSGTSCASHSGRAL